MHSVMCWDFKRKIGGAEEVGRQPMLMHRSIPDPRAPDSEQAPKTSRLHASKRPLVPPLFRPFIYRAGMALGLSSSRVSA